MNVIIWINVNGVEIILQFRKINNVMLCANINEIIDKCDDDIILDIIDENWKNIIIKLNKFSRILKVRSYDEIHGTKK